MIRLVSLLVLCSVAFAADVQERIKGGTTAAPAEFPYQASIQLNNEHICGGALITSRHVVTSASCLVRILANPNLLQYVRVLIGTISLKKDGYYFGVSRLSIHPEYQYNSKSLSFVNDIGVLHIRGEAPSNVWVKPINLPGITEVPEKSEFLFTGWGSVVYPIGPNVELLQKAKLYYINNQECQKYFPNDKIKPYQLCTAANHYVGTCTTDNGSPLVYQNQLVGIATNVHGCAGGTPDVFTKVSYYLKYITDEVNYPSARN